MIQNYLLLFKEYRVVRSYLVIARIGYCGRVKLACYYSNNFKG